MRHVIVVLILGWCLFGAPVLAADYGSIDEAEYQQLLRTIESEPDYLAHHRDIPRRLTTEQWDRLVGDLGLNPYTWVHPVVVKGNKASAVLGTPIEDLGLMAVRAGKLVPIPFQIDEKDEDGWVYVEGVSDAGVAGRAGTLDAEDEIVFMLRDAGTETLPADQQPPSGKLVQEIRVATERGDRYAYVVTGGPVRSPARYVRYDENRRQFESTFYNFVQSQDNLLIFDTFRANAGPTPDHRVLDALILDLSTGVVTRWPRLSVGVENLEARLLGVKHGPIRDVLLMQIRVVVANIPVFFIRTDMMLYDQGISLPVRLNIPGGEILTRVLNRPVIDLGLDMHDLQGGRFAAAVNPTGQMGKVDGKISSVEQKMNIDIPEAAWMWLESGRGWDVMLKVDIPPDWPVQADLLYVDAADPEVTFDVEDFPGALPRFGARVNELPKGKLNIDLSAILWFPATVGALGPDGFARASEQTPTVQVREL